jgi:hypothetical protein
VVKKRIKQGGSPQTIKKEREDRLELLFKRKIRAGACRAAQAYREE